MARRIYSSESTTNVTVTTTTETVVVTVSGITTSQPGETIRIKAQCQFTTGTAATALTWRVRRGTVTGTVVNEDNAEQVEAVAGSTNAGEVMCEDSFAGEVAEQVYVLTVQQTAATADGTALFGYIEATVG